MPVQAKSENAKEGKASHVADPSEDLFADYAFSDKSARADSLEQEFDATPTPAPDAWHASLPRLTREQAQLSEAVNALPPTLSRQALDALDGVLARYTHNTTDDISFHAFEIEETAAPVADPVAQTSETTAPRVYVVLGVEPGGARVTAETDAAFAASLVNLVLGGEGSAPDSLRPLSRAELAVIEFLWLNILRAVNELAGAPIWRMDGVTAEVPAGFGERREQKVSRNEKDETRATERVLMLPLQLTAGTLSGLVRFYFTAATLRALNEASNPLLAKREGRRARLSRWARIAPEVSLRLSVGEAKLTGAELSQLDAGDVVLVSTPHAEWRAGRLEGRVLLLAGDARNLQIRGRAQASELLLEQAAGEALPTESLAVEVEAVSVFDAPVAVGHLRMNEEQTDEYEDADGLSIERLALTLRVELATRNVTLEELSNLRPGQLLDLGCKPTDPVDLVAGGRRVASGELVDFEGHLGVRITEVSRVLT
ncbi:MAG TPA: type III secretion system cytoplasmic ring protein SctQ [Pyrinomonadaceae bacterium]|nr:type III secretion system cytoplasmic ring protein SctQ [Pyrinomonadaceae bacterium]